MFPPRKDGEFKHLLFHWATKDNLQWMNLLHHFVPQTTKEILLFQLWTRIINELHISLFLHTWVLIHNEWHCQQSHKYKKLLESRGSKYEAWLVVLFCRCCFKCLLNWATFHRGLIKSQLSTQPASGLSETTLSNEVMKLHS